MGPLRICLATISQLVQSQGGAPSISASTMNPCNCPTTKVATFLGLLDLLVLQLLCFAVCELVRGELVDVSEDEAMANTCAPWAEVGLFIGGNNRMTRGPNGPRTRDRSGPLWRAKNGHINFGYGDWAQWTNAFHFLGLPAIAENPDFISTFGRHQKDTRPVRDGLEETMATRDKWEVFHGLAKVRCISGVVQNTKELAENDHLNARGFLVDSSVNGKNLTAPGPFAQLSATPMDQDLRCPSNWGALTRRTSSTKERDEGRTDLGRELLAT